MRAATFESRRRHQPITAWRWVLRFGSASSNSLASNGEITSANNHAGFRPLLAPATPTTIDNIIHEKRTVRITLMSPLFVSNLFERGRTLSSGPVSTSAIRFLVALAPVQDLLLSAKLLFVAAKWWQIALPGRSMMSNGTASALNSAQDLAQSQRREGAFAASLSRDSKALAYQWCLYLRRGTDTGGDRRSGRTPQRGKPSGILDFTWARDFEPHDGLSALKRIGRYSRITKKAKML
jgi:hypothetical protein